MLWLTFCEVTRLHLGILDAIIAEVAVEAGFPLHTFNQKHYQPHPLLKTIQPYKK